MISRTTIDTVRMLPIKDVIGRYVTDLKPAGGSFRAKSPFTEEKTASFYVVPGKNIFKCFSSGKGGDAITFVMEHTGKKYIDAVIEICSDHSIPVERDNSDIVSKDETDFTESLYIVNRSAVKNFTEQLHTIWPLNGSPTDHPLTEELTRRGYSTDTIVEWNLGYAPDAWNFLSHKMVHAGFHKQGIELGLIKDKEGRTYDTFRHRLIFPIQDERGYVVAFGGRDLPGAVHTKPADKVPKYINSADSRIFKKSKVLYGLHHAIPCIRKAGYANLVEGYTDVISMHQAGLENTVGSCGTSLTADQCKLLKRYTDNVVIFFDGDAAGQAATERAGMLLIEEGFSVQNVVLPEGKDPHDFVKMFYQEQIEENGKEK